MYVEELQGRRGMYKHRPNLRLQLAASRNDVHPQRIVRSTFRAALRRFYESFPTGATSTGVVNQEDAR